MSDRFNRRAFLGVAAAAAGALIQDTVKAGRVYDPERAGRPQTPITAADNDAGIQAVEKKLRCTCGCGLDVYTCRTTDFQCTYSPALHKQVLTLAGQGKTAQQIIDAFVAQYGLTALMAPPRRGFNLVGYLVPGVLILAAAGLLLWMLDRWTRESGAASSAAPIAPPDATAEELARLQRELDRIPG